MRDRTVDGGRSNGRPLPALHPGLVRCNRTGRRRAPPDRLACTATCSPRSLQPESAAGLYSRRQGRGAAGFASGSAGAALEAAEGGTRFRDAARIRPGGRLARAGARPIGGTVRKPGADPPSRFARSGHAAAPRGGRTDTGGTNTMPVEISMNVNGKAVSAEVEDRTLLVEMLRENLRLTGTHVGCDTSQCGACVVHVDGRSVKACTMLARQAQGADVTHHRRAGGRRQAPSHAGGVPPEPRAAMRLLHPRDGHERTRPRGPQSGPERGPKSASGWKETFAGARATTTS